MLTKKILALRAVNMICGYNTGQWRFALRLLFCLALATVIAGPSVAQTRPKPPEPPGRAANANNKILNELGEVAGMLSAAEPFVPEQGAGAEPHPCKDSRLFIMSLKLDGAASTLQSDVTDPRSRAILGREIFDFYMDLAEIERKRGCLYSQRTIFQSIMVQMPGAEFTGYHERARVGIDDVRAATDGKPVDQLPWPLGPYVKKSP